MHAARNASEGEDPQLFCGIIDPVTLVKRLTTILDMQRNKGQASPDPTRRVAWKSLQTGGLFQPEEFVSDFYLPVDRIRKARCTG